MKTLIVSKLLTSVLAAGLLLGAAGCATTRQVSPDAQSGFLGDYSMLRQGVGVEANYLYINHQAPWAKYTKVWLKPLELWKSDDPEAPLGKLTSQSQQMLVDTAYDALYEALTNNFQMVDQGGPDVLVIHAAITDGRRSKPVNNIVASVYVPRKVESFGDRLIGGAELGVGETVIEVDFRDGQTGQRVAAAMDGQASAKAFGGKSRCSWNEVKLAFDWWARQLDKRLTLLRKGDFGTTNL